MTRAVTPVAPTCVTPVGKSSVSPWRPCGDSTVTRSRPSTGGAPNADSWALDARVKYEFPGTAHTTENVVLHWYHGGQRPPDEVVKLIGDRKLQDQGSIYIGTEGVLYSPYIAEPVLLPAEKFKEIPLEQLWIYQGTKAGPLAADQAYAAAPNGRPDHPFIFRMGSMAPTLAQPGGEVRIVDSSNFPVSKTVAVPVDRLYNAFLDGAARKRWLPDGELRTRTALEPKSARFDWGGGETRVNVFFTAKDTAKSSVAIQHERLADGEEAAAHPVGAR